MFLLYKVLIIFCQHTGVTICTKLIKNGLVFLAFVGCGLDGLLISYGTNAFVFSYRLGLRFHILGMFISVFYSDIEKVKEKMWMCFGGSLGHFTRSFKIPRGNSMLKRAVTPLGMSFMCF